MATPAKFRYGLRPIRHKRLQVHPDDTPLYAQSQTEPTNNRKKNNYAIVRRPFIMHLIDHTLCSSCNRIQYMDEDKFVIKRNLATRAIADSELHLDGRVQH